MGGKRQIIVQGDSTTRLAFQHGFFPDTVWNAPENAALRAQRSDKNVLMPGDVLVIPDKTPKTESVQTGKWHRFRRRGVPEKLRVRFYDLYGEPLANQGYVLTVDGAVSEGQLDGDGWLNVPISPGARVATIDVGPEGELAHVTMDIGALDPVEELSGLQMRLHNLGYFRGAVDGREGTELTEAVRRFQTDNDLPATGEPDDATRAKLRAAHGC